MICREELQIKIHIGKSRKPKETKRKSQIFKKFSDGVMRFEFEGEGGNKVKKNGKVRTFQQNVYLKKKTYSLN